MDEGSLFTEALRQSDPAERAVYLNATCAGDAALRRVEGVPITQFGDARIEASRPGDDGHLTTRFQ